MVTIGLARAFIIRYGLQLRRGGMRRSLKTRFFLIPGFILLLLAACSSAATSIPVETPAPTPALAPEPTATPFPTATPSPTPTPVVSEPPSGQPGGSLTVAG